MLQVLRVTDFVLFGQVDIEFGDHLNVITGETGAGKSILLGAVELLLGGESSSRLIRVGAERAVVEGLFNLTAERCFQLKAAGFLNDESASETIIRREIFSSGRSRCFINGTLANLSMLRSLGQELIQVHGQQEHQMMVKSGRQLELLDTYGILTDQRKSFSELLSRFRAVDRNLAKIEESIQTRKRERELARFQRDEIDKAEVSLEEQKALKEELALLENSEQISETVSAILAELEGDDRSVYSAGGQGATVLGTLGSLRKLAAALSGITGKASPLLAQIDEARFTLEEVVSGLRNLDAGIEHNPERLEQLRAREDELYRLKKKYGPELEDVLAFRDKVDRLLREGEQQENDLETLRSERDTLLARLQQEAKQLSCARKAAARKLEKEVSKRLASLGMPSGRFEVSFKEPASEDIEQEYLTSGADRITFLLSTNPGVPLMPLSEVASGGELSRIMLAIISSLARVEAPSIMIFDEVDSGIGGKVGGMVGLYLSEIAEANQVLVVTHLAQIASCAEVHLMVEKFSHDEHTETMVKVLDQEHRPREIARMLGGDSKSETSLAHARQMLERTQKGASSR